MEEVLDTYEEPYDKDYPVLCMDEQPVQLHKEVRNPIAATKNHAKRVDYEYERCGTACVFMLTEPLSDWRQANVRPQRTKVDWALDMASLPDTRYKKARKVILVCDNLNTHTKGAFYEAFPPAKARAYVKRIDFRYTPTHGSWLNIAENELSSMTRQCVSGRRFESLRKIQSEIAHWSDHSSHKQRGVDWQFRVQDARRKLKSLYPKLKV